MMNPMRRTTPDSEAVASSEDERPWPSAPAFGSLPRKENSVPGLGGGIWAQRRGSIGKMDKFSRSGNGPGAQRDARLGPPATSPGILRNTPSPSVSEGSNALPFAIPLHPTPKAGRSLSHSQGQREMVGSHPSAVEQAPNLPLGLLSEEVDTEDDSELGGPLTHTVSHPAPPTFHRPAFYPPIYDAVRTPSDSSEFASGRPNFTKGERGLEGSLGHMSLDHPNRRLWESHLGWEDLPGPNESRRHSLADIPTRRGSLSTSAAQNPGVQLRGGAYWSPRSEDYEFESGERQSDFGDNPLFQTKSNIARANPTDPAKMKYNDKDEHGQPLEVPSMYKVPFIEIAEHERTEADKRAAAAGNLASQAQFGVGRPKKQLFIVSFKCSRVDVFYLLENTGLIIKEGDIVIVEADRGQDLGTVQHSNVTPDEARLYKRKYGEEQYKWLMMFSRNNAQGSVNPNAQVYGENQAARNSNMLAGAPAAMQGLPRDNFNNLKPKAIKRLASGHEIRMLGEKEGNEAKAKRTCQQKVNHLHLDMEILDAEWQWDFQKLIFYYYADHYINFKDLITELYRIYKTRIWLSAINPASFSQHAHGQPPSGIGPGAIAGYNNPGMNNTYTMAYGPDPDPYGAVPPYRIGYETYTPNYPGIPGVANSFAPPAAGFHAGGSEVPSVAPGIASTGSVADYSYYYDRSAAGAASGVDSDDPTNPSASASRAPGQPDQFQYFHPAMSTVPNSSFQGTPTQSGPPPFSPPPPGHAPFPPHSGLPVSRLGAIGSRQSPAFGTYGGPGSIGGMDPGAFVPGQGAQHQRGDYSSAAQRRQYNPSRMGGPADFAPSPQLSQSFGFQNQQGPPPQQQQQFAGPGPAGAAPPTAPNASGQGQSATQQRQRDGSIQSYMQSMSLREDASQG